MKAQVKWVENSLYIAEAESGHGVLIDGPPALGGRNLGVRPMEMILMGLGGCISLNVMEILAKSRQPVVDCVAELQAERAETVPKVFTIIHVNFVVTGSGLKESSVERAVSLSIEKYCSGARMLSASVDITHSFEIREAGADSVRSEP